MTSWSLIWLVATVLLVAGGALNLSQRAYHDLPPTDGVLWVQRDGRNIRREGRPRYLPRREPASRQATNS